MDCAGYPTALPIVPFGSPEPRDGVRDAIFDVRGRLAWRASLAPRAVSPTPQATQLFLELPDPRLGGFTGPSFGLSGRLHELAVGAHEAKAYRLF